MKQVRIDMDAVNIFWLLDPGSQRHFGTTQLPASLEISQNLYDEYKEVAKRFFELNEQLEQLYRVQQNMTPWQVPPVPDHRIINDK